MPSPVVAEVVEHRPTAAIRVQQFLTRSGQKTAQTSNLLRHEGLSRAGNVLLVDPGSEFVDAGGRQDPVPGERACAVLNRVFSSVDWRKSWNNRIGAENGVPREKAVLRG